MTTISAFLKVPASYSKIPMSTVITRTTRFFSSSLTWSPVIFFKHSSNI